MFEPRLGPHFIPIRVFQPAHELDMRAVEHCRVRSPIHTRCAEQSVPLVGGGIDTGQRLLVGQEQRLVRGVELGLADLRRCFRGEAARLHEVERLGEPVGELA